MGKIISNGNVYSGCGDYASKIKFDHSSTSLAANNVQSALVEVDNNITECYNNLTSDIETINTKIKDTGNSISLDIDEESWVMTLSLLNEDGEVIDSKEIDFPIESAIVNASYDEDTKKLTFTLQSGVEINVPIGDIINGLTPNSRTIAGVNLVDDITKEELNTALGVDTLSNTLSTHTSNTTSHVTASERSTWNKNTTDISTLNTDLTDLCKNTAVSIYDKTKLSTGIINSSGEVTDNQYYGVTDYIKVRKGSNIKTSILSNSWDDVYCAFYDNSQVFVSSKKEDAELNIISPCDGYVRFCVNASYINNAIITSTDIADTVNSLNASLCDYGLNNVFDGTVLQGYYDTTTGVLVTSGVNTVVVSQNKIVCGSGDTVTIQYGSDDNITYGIWFYNGNTLLEYNPINKAIAPPNTTHCYIGIGNTNGITPNTVGHISVYVNNAIDKLNENTTKLNTDLTDLTSSVAVNLFNSTLKSLKEMNTSGTWSGNVYTKDGMTVTVNSDLSLKFVGKATPSWGVYFYTKHIDLKIGNYTFSCLNSNNNIYGFLARPNAQTLNVKGSTSTFSVAEDITSNDIGIICNYNVDINTTVYPMIERGTVAHPYQPCIGADSIPKSISELNENLAKSTITSTNVSSVTVDLSPYRIAEVIVMGVFNTSQVNNTGHFIVYMSSDGTTNYVETVNTHGTVSMSVNSSKIATITCGGYDSVTVRRIL